jgi:hypothetical protein
MDLKHMLELASVLTKEFRKKTPLQVSEDSLALNRVARKLQHLNEDYCNGEVDSEVYQEKKDKIREKMKELGYEAHLNGDPRGAAIKLILPSGLTNDWGHEGFCVPE